MIDDLSQNVSDACKMYEGSGLRTLIDDELSLIPKSAHGIKIKDERGKEYFDLSAGFSVAAVGYGHPKILEAIQEQAEKLTHCPSLYPTRNRLKLAEVIVKSSPIKDGQLLWGQSGSQANEMAINIARSYTKKSDFITFSGGYYGRSNGVIGLNGVSTQRGTLNLPKTAQVFPFPEEKGLFTSTVVLELVSRAINECDSAVNNIAAVILEPIQGKGGVLIPPTGFLEDLKEVCLENDVLLIFDEIQSGMGRSGRMWACEHEGVTPDLITLGKALGGGLPLSCVVGRTELMKFWPTDTVSSTFMTNPLSIATGLATFKIFEEENLVQRSHELGLTLLSELQDRLQKFNQVKDIRGRGLFLGIEFFNSKDLSQDSFAKRVRQSCFEKGVILSLSGTTNNVIRLTPPLTISKEELLASLNIIEESIRETESML